MLPKISEDSSYIVLHNTISYVHKNTTQISHVPAKYGISFCYILNAMETL